MNISRRDAIRAGAAAVAAAALPAAAEPDFALDPLALTAEDLQFMDLQAWIEAEYSRRLREHVEWPIIHGEGVPCGCQTCRKERGCS